MAKRRKTVKHKRGGSAYAAIKAAGIPTDHHESDLYVLATPEARRILKEHGKHFTSFISQIDQKVWLDVPFAYEPFWERKTGKRDPGIIRDERASKRAPFGFVVATDTFLSGWGETEGGKSYYAIAVESESEGYTVMDNLKHRPEMKRIRWVKSLKGIRLGPHDHLSVADKSIAPRYFQPGAFRDPGHRRSRRDPAGYQGWANWETWNVALWFGNDEGLYHAVLDYRPRGGWDADVAADFVYEMLPKGTPDMKSAKELAKVDWNEIAADFREMSGEDE